MTVGLPGAGIGGLFYLASTLLLPVRSIVRRLRGRPDAVNGRGQAHLVLMAIAIMGSLWLAGWLLAFVVPERMLASSSVAATAAASRTVIPLATFGIGAGTLAMVLIAVEIAHYVHALKGERSTRRPR
jgi:hypothetical protein